MLQREKTVRAVQLRRSPEVLAALARGPARFNAVKHATGINGRVLAYTLRALEEACLVGRALSSGKTMPVEYRLTPLGAAAARFFERLRAGVR